MRDHTILRYTAFTDTPDGGNPAGVWLGETLPEPETMRAIAREVGYSETAFAVPTDGNSRTVRYYSPEAEVAFCGHATIALGVVLGESEGPGVYRLLTAVGEVPVEVREREGRREAALTSVEPAHEPASAELVAEALTALGWAREELDDRIPPARAFAGNWHLVLTAASLERLNDLDYDFDRLRALMRRDGLTTLQLVWREDDAHFHARDPFPVGGVVEDPATGAAAAAFGGYLRDAGLLTAPTTLTIRQGEAMGRPSRIVVEVPEQGGIRVAGTAVPVESAGTNP